MRTPWRWNKQDEDLLRKMGIAPPQYQYDTTERKETVELDANAAQRLIESLPESACFIITQREMKTLNLMMRDLRNAARSWRRSELLWRRIALFAWFSVMATLGVVVFASLSRRFGW